MAYRILYLAGSPRSGSTLLSDMLGAQPRVFNAGELSLFWRDANRGSSCACGLSIPACPVWGPALRSVERETGLGPESWKTLAHTRAYLSRPRNILAVLSLTRKSRDAWPSEVTQVVHATEALLTSVCDQLGASIVVDSSKTPSGLLFDQLSGRDVQMVHLVRDPRAVVASSRRSRGVKRHNVQSLPPGAGSLEGTVRWMKSNLASMAIGRRVPSTLVLTYERLTDDPAATLQRVCRGLNLERSPSAIVDHSLVLQEASHAAVGNPVRQDGRVRRIRPDHRWQSELPLSHAYMIRLVTSPLRAILIRQSQRPHPNSSPSPS